MIVYDFEHAGDAKVTPVIDGNAPSLCLADIPSEGRGCHPARAERFAHGSSLREGRTYGMDKPIPVQIYGGKCQITFERYFARMKALAL